MSERPNETDSKSVIQPCCIGGSTPPLSAINSFNVPNAFWCVFYLLNLLIFSLLNVIFIVNSFMKFVKISKKNIMLATKIQIDIFNDENECANM